MKETWEKSRNNLFFEYRISIYGKSIKDWSNLAKWAIKNDLINPEKNFWVVQIPRNYHLLQHSGSVKNFQQFLDNIFLPLFEVSLDPSVDPDLHFFLQNVSGIDSVDRENSFEKKFRSHKVHLFYFLSYFFLFFFYFFLSFIFLLLFHKFFCIFY